jgi:2-dehydropantoate 2-reductase
MRHAILGVGGVGGLIAAALAKCNEDVTLVLRPESMDAYPDSLSLQSPFGNFSVAVNRSVILDSDVDVVWIAVKATQLDAALQRIPSRFETSAVVPLLNGIDHVRYLRKIYGDTVVPATIAVESERVAPGQIVHRTPFARLNVAATGEKLLAPVVEKLGNFGFECRFVANEVTMLWSKLVFLAPLALVTTASQMNVGDVRGDDRWRGVLESCFREACTVAGASGGRVDAESLWTALIELPPASGSSMQRDVAAGRVPELDAIAGPIIRGAEAHGLSVVTTREMVEVIQRMTVGSRL